MAGWIFVIGERNALHWVLAEQRMAFREHVNTDRLKPGDSIVVYATRGCWHNPTRDRGQVAAVGTIASPVVPSSVDVSGEIMPYSCRLALEVVLPERHGVPFDTLVTRLPLTRSRTHWGPLLRHTIVKLSAMDIKVIQSAVAKAARTAETRT
jgi:hypothetical protein